MSEMVLIVVEARKFTTEFPEDNVYETSYGDQYFTGDIVAEVVPGYTTDNIFYSAELVDENSRPYETRGQKQLEITPEQHEQISATLATKLAKQIESDGNND